MSHWRLRTRLLLAYTLLLCLGFAGLAWLAGGQLARGAEEDFGRGLETQAALVARSLKEDVEHLAEGEGSLQQVGQRGSALAEQADARLLLVDGRGRAWFDSTGATLPPGLLDAPEITLALAGQASSTTRRDEAGQMTIYAAAPLIEDERVLAVVQLSRPASAAAAFVEGRWMALGVGVLSLGLLSVIASLGLAATLTRPLEQLRVSVLRVAAGDFSQRLPESGGEIGEVAAAFNHMAVQVQAMVEAQRAFASNASHELRTPLTTIRLRSEALRQGALEPATARQYIQEIDEEVTRLGGLVEDLILLSRLDAGRAERGQEEIEIPRLLHSLLHEVAHQAEAQGVTLHLETTGALPPVQASLNHLRVVLRNLLSNAIRYTPTGGKVVCSVAAEGTMLWLKVADTGQGVTAEDLPHLFERFYRADKAHGRTTKGTGLGLALVQSIVGVYGGRITVESAGIGRGTTVQLWWPLPPLESEAKSAVGTPFDP